jgi:outer membrane protein assembly factor BamB
MKPLSTLVSLALLVPTLRAQQTQTFDRLTFHAAPQALASDARTSDWPRQLGPQDNAASPETKLLHEWLAAGPATVWEIAKGDGYTAPVIVGDHCVLFHALDGKEVIDCVHAESGKRFWSQSYAIDYQDRLGYANGPRGSAVISEGTVITMGVTAMVHAFDLATGKQLWVHDLKKEQRAPQEFFGHGATPLIWKGKVIINVGGKGELTDVSDDKRERMRKLATAGVCVAAYDLKSGEMLWHYDDAWGSSYACPIVADLHGQPRLLVFAGAESDPPIGGLLCIDPDTGKLFDRTDWRADMYTSVNASSPVIIPAKNRVFVTTAYPKGKPIGGLMLEYDAQWKAKELWRSGKIACHWMTPLYRDGHLYAIDGETEGLARMVCVNADTGAEVWEHELKWEMPVEGRSYKLSILRASLLDVDGATLCLGETGSLHWLDLSPTGCKELSRAQLWLAPHTWSLPAISRGLLYVAQHERDQLSGARARFVCYDLRGK